MSNANATKISDGSHVKAPAKVPRDRIDGEGMVKVYDAVTGEPRRVNPIDASHNVALGVQTWEPPRGGDAGNGSGVREPFNFSRLRLDDLRKMAVTAKVPYDGLTKVDLIAKLEAVRYDPRDADNGDGDAGASGDTDTGNDDSAAGNND